ncbi:pyridoxal phosphate-dependent aminotransferase [Alphaproteobacteria bacterium]|nr:pyridoxal phosphate-dependent aminotransferase [Alphaproteobacteria bacterium]
MKYNFISDRINNIKPSPTIAVTSKARELKAAGKDVIGLGAGEPDFDTPTHIKNAAIEAIKMGKTKYTAVDGIPELKEAIVEKFFRDNKISYKTNEISVGAGGKQVLFNALLATINKGDEVIIPSPYWVSYPDMVVIAEGFPVIIETSINNDFKVTPKKLIKAITNRTKWIIINSPSNPTGSCYTSEELVEIGKILDDFPHLGIISDDIYEKIIYDDFKFCTLATVVPRHKDRILTVNGVSKSYSMTGWRIGYAGASKEIIKAMAKIQSQSTTNPSSISQYAALEALKGQEDFITKNNQKFKKRRDLISDIINNCKGLSVNRPSGAFYIFPSCANLLGSKTKSGKVIKNDTDFCDYLIEEVGVAVVPGTAFGAKDFFRISYATSDELLLDAGKRIQIACDKLR